jgi:CRP-like cAMP-binding protein
MPMNAQASQTRALDPREGELPLEAEEMFAAVASRAVYRVRQRVFHEGSPCAGLYLVCSGAVRLYHSDRLGREHVLGVAGPGAVLGEFAIDPTAPLSISAEALTHTELAFLPRQRLASLLRRHPDSAVWLIDALSRELRRARTRVRDIALRGGEARLAALLLSLVESGNASAGERRIPLRYRRREIAEMIGVSTETAIRLLAKLHSKGVISVRRRDIAVVDPIELARIAEQDDIATLHVLHRTET